MNYNLCIETDTIEKVCAKTENIIGGISSAMIEAYLMGKKCYMYTPKEFGLTYNHLNSSVYFNIKDIAKNENDLYNNIKNESCSFKFNKNDLNGVAISKINFDILK